MQFESTYKSNKFALDGDIKNAYNERLPGMSKIPTGALPLNFTGGLPSSDPKKNYFYKFIIVLTTNDR